MLPLHARGKIARSGPDGTSPVPIFALVVIPPLLAAGLVSSVDGPTADAEAGDEPRRRLEELFLGDLIYPQERGELQVTTGLRHERDRGERATTLPVVVEWGLSDRLQLELNLPYRLDSTEDSSGIANVGIGALYQLDQDQDGGPRVAVGVDWTFPDELGGAEDWSIQPFVLTYRKGEAFDINAGLGLEFADEDGDRALGGAGAVALIADLGPCVGTFELLGEFADGDFGLSAAPGAVWRLGHFEIGCAVAVGLTDAAPDVQVLVTLTRAWSLARPR